MQSTKPQEVASKIRALQELTDKTGFKTTRSQGELLRTLNTAELAAVAELLKGAHRG